MHICINDIKYRSLVWQTEMTLKNFFGRSKQKSKPLMTDFEIFTFATKIVDDLLDLSGIEKRP